MKNEFKNLNELYNCTGYFYKYKRYLDYIKLIKGNFKPYILNQITGQEIHGLEKINKYLRIENIEYEI